MAEWAKGTEPPLVLSGYGCAAVGNNIHCMGGRTTGSSLYASKIVQIYNTMSKSWSYGADMLVDGEYLSCISVGNKIYCFDTHSASGIVQIYDTLNDTWSKGRDAPYALNSFGCAAVGENIYCIGGYYKYDPSNDLQTVHAYNTVSDFWQLLTSLMPTKREGLACVSIDNNIYCMGGYYQLGYVEIFDTITREWAKATSMPTGKSTFGATNYLNDIYCTGFQISPVEIYDVVQGSWRFGEVLPTYQIRQLVIAGNYLYAFSDGYPFYYFDLRTASITNPNPTAGFINEKNTNSFNWTLESNPAGTGQKSAIFQWRTRGASTIHDINVGSTQSLTIPANTLPNGEFEWRVSATNTAGITAPFTDWFLLTTIDERPGQPTGLYPSSGTRDGTKVIQFSWLHNSPLSTPQSAFELQITYDGGYTWRALSNKITTAVTQFTTAANTILATDPTGRIGWRVHTYNSDNIASDWSNTAFFIVHPAPQRPNWISVESGRSRPLCRWISLGQVGFQLQVTSGDTIIFDSDEIHGATTEYRIPDFLLNGIFNFRVRIKNIRALWSEWAIHPVSINARSRLNISLCGEAVTNGAQLTFDAEVRASG